MLGTFTFIFATVLSIGAVAQGLGELPLLDSQELRSRHELFQYATSFLTIEERPEPIEQPRGLQIQPMALRYVDALHDRVRLLDFDVYRLPGYEPKAAVILFPPLRGLSRFDMGFARYFARRGYLAVISKVGRDITEFSHIPPIMQEFVDVAVDNRVLVDVLINAYGIDPGSIGVVGVSLGGIRAGIFHGIEPRITGSATVVGGGNLPAIMAYSQERRVTALRERVFRAMNFTSAEQYEVYLREQLIWDPIYSAQLRQEGTYMAIGTLDDKVPSVNQLELHRNYNCQHGVFYRGGHNQTAAFVYLSKGQIEGFFSRRFTMPPVVDEMN